MLSIVIK